MARPIDPEKRHAILQAAKKIILNEGYQAAKISDIASAAGVAAGTVYLYFESKEAIAAAISSDFFARAGAISRKHVPRFLEPNGIEDYIDAVVKFATAEKDILVEIRPNPNLAKDDYSKEKHAELHGEMAELLQQLIDKGLIQNYNTTALTSIIFGIMHGIVIGAVVFEDLPLNEYKKTAAEFIRRAIRPL